MIRGFTFLLLALHLCFQPAHAQQKPATAITGQVVDSANGKEISYATITLLRAADMKPVNNALSDEKGKFSFHAIPYGQYKIGYSVVGYTAALSETVVLDSLHRTFKLDTRQLVKTSQQLKGVEVTAQKPLLEMKDDKLVYNVENDINKDNLTASEMLRRVPMVTVDMDGNIKLKGSDNFKVYLNGKSTSVVAKSPKDALKSFPANIIKSIEVISEPSAKYDADGAAGIINIITKKKFSGYNGSLSANYNTLNQGYGGGSVNAKFGKFGISSYLGVSIFGNKNRMEGRTENYIPGFRTTLEQSSEGKFNGKYGYANLELSYDLDSSSSISVYGNLNGNDYKNTRPELNHTYNENRQLIRTGNYLMESKNTWNSYDLGLDYQKKFKNPEHELTFSTNFNNDKNGGNTNNSQVNDPGVDNYYRNINDEKNTETTFQLDYSLPLPKEMKLETGAKAIFRNIESDYEQSTRDEDGKYVPNPRRSNVFKYGQDVLAYYATYRFKIKKKLSIRLGARVENTRIDGRFISSDTSIRANYTNFIPTVNIMLPFKNPGNMVTFAYSRRLQRPWVWNLNPFVDDNDPNNIRYGNPNLNPEFNHSFGLNYSGMVFKKLRINTGANHTFTNNAIEQYATIDESKGITSFTFANIGKRSSTGINFNTNVPITKKWNLNTNLRAEYTVLNNNNNLGNLRNDGWSGNGYASTDYDFGKGFKGELSVYFSTSRPTLQGRNAGYYANSIALRKELFDKKMTLSLGLDQPFQKERVWKSTVKDESFLRYSAFYNPARALRIGVRWNFGKLKEPVSRKKGVSNDDLKQGGGNSGGGQ